MCRDETRDETRDVVAMEFEDLAGYPEIVEAIERVLLAAPFPASADPDGAIEACRRTDSRQSVELFEKWVQLQPSVAAVRHAAKLAISAGLVLRNYLADDVPHPDILTDRQREILAFVGAGLRLKDIAAQCGLSLTSASSHKYRAMHRLGLQDRIAVFHYCQMHGLIPNLSEQVPSSKD